MYELLESFFFFSPSQGPLTNPLGAEHQIKQTPSVDMVVRSYSTHSSTCLYSIPTAFHRKTISNLVECKCRVNKV